MMRRGNEYYLTESAKKRDIGQKKKMVKIMSHPEFLRSL